MLGFLETIIKTISSGFSSVIDFIVFISHNLSMFVRLAGGWSHMVNAFCPPPLQIIGGIILTVCTIRLVVSLGGH